MLEDIKAIAELEPSGIVHIAVFLCFHKLYKFYLFGSVLLLGCQPLVQKTPIYRPNFKVNTIHFQRNSKLFFFFCSVLQECPMFHFWYMHLTIIAAHKYLHAKQKTITRNIKNRGNKNCPSFSVALSTRYKDKFSWKIWLKYFHSPQSKKKTVVLTLPSWGSQPRMSR